jgi:hypothetical protein
MGRDYVGRGGKSIFMRIMMRMKIAAFEIAGTGTGGDGGAMLKAGGGVIVNVGSMSGDIVNYPQQQANYNSSKAAVHHLTRSLAAEWAARGVRVNAVAPTYIATDLTKQAAADPEILKHRIDGTPMGRLGQPEEIASVILFLAGGGEFDDGGGGDGGWGVWVLVEGAWLRTEKSGLMRQLLLQGNRFRLTRPFGGLGFRGNPGSDLRVFV